jgi:chromosome segregation ATPase
MTTLQEQLRAGVQHYKDVNGAESAMSEAADKLDTLESQINKWETALTAVMPPDFKDWHQNSKAEWPEIAASTLVNLRERLGEANAWAERLEAHNMALLADVKDCQQQSRDYQAENAVIKSQMAELKAQIKAESDAHESWQNEHLKVDGEQCRQIRELEAQVAELTTAIAAQKGTA